MTSRQSDYLASTSLIMYFSYSASMPVGTLNVWLFATDVVHASVEIIPRKTLLVLLEDLEKVGELLVKLVMMLMDL